MYSCWDERNGWPTYFMLHHKLQCLCGSFFCSSGLISHSKAATIDDGMDVLGLVSQQAMQAYLCLHNYKSINISKSESLILAQWSPIYEALNSDELAINLFTSSLSSSDSVIKTSSNHHSSESHKVDHHIMAALQQTLSNRRQTKRSCSDSGSSDDEPEQFPRWLIIQGTDDSRPLSKLSLFAIGKSLKSQVCTPDTVKCLQWGNLHAQSNKKTYIDLLLCMTSLDVERICQKVLQNNRTASTS